MELFSNGCSPGDIHQGARAVTRALHSFYVGVSVGWHSKIALVDTELPNMIVTHLWMGCHVILTNPSSCWCLCWSCWWWWWWWWCGCRCRCRCCCFLDHDDHDGFEMARALPGAGELGDCWFLSAIACLSAREEKKPKEKQMKELHLDMNWLWLRTTHLNPHFRYLGKVK